MRVLEVERPRDPDVRGTNPVHSHATCHEVGTSSGEPRGSEAQASQQSELYFLPGRCQHRMLEPL